MSKLTFYYKFKLIINKLSDDYRKRRESGKNWIFLFSQFWQHPIIFNPHDSNWKKNETLVIISLGFVQNRRYQIEMNKILFEYFIDSFTDISEYIRMIYQMIRMIYKKRHDQTYDQFLIILFQKLNVWKWNDRLKIKWFSWEDNLLTRRIMIR